MNELNAFFQRLKGSHIPKPSDERAGNIVATAENQALLGIDCCDVNDTCCDTCDA